MKKMRKKIIIEDDVAKLLYIVVNCKEFYY